MVSQLRGKCGNRKSSRWQTSCHGGSRHELRLRRSEVCGEGHAFSGRTDAPHLARLGERHAAVCRVKEGVLSPEALDVSKICMQR